MENSEKTEEKQAVGQEENKMKKRGITMILTVLLVAAAAFGYAVFGDTAEPGSGSDPLVSKSYVDAKTAYIPVQLTAGQKMIGGAGTEIILRSGIATAIGNSENGIADLTGGADLMTGASVELNHLLLVPRNDGRGITAVTDIWVMVRGEYSVN